MGQMQLSSNVDCSSLTTDEINFRVKDLIFNKHTNILLKNVHDKSGLLEGLKGVLKIEMIGDLSSNFANNVSELKIIVNGNVGDNSACNVSRSKFTVFGSCLSNFGGDARSSEFYILENCGKSSFSNLNNGCKVVIGGQPNSDFALGNDGASIIILNLKGGSIFVEDGWFKNYKSGRIYIRGTKDSIKNLSNIFSLKEVSETDEDIYLPLISEFARLFSCSLSEIKSMPFFRIDK